MSSTLDTLADGLSTVPGSSQLSWELGTLPQAWDRPGPQAMIESGAATMGTMLAIGLGLGILVMILAKEFSRP